MMSLLAALVFLLCPLSLFFTTASNSLAALPTIETTSTSTYVHFPNRYEGVIFSAETAPDLIAWGVLRHVDAYRTASVEEIATLEVYLADFIKENANQFTRDIVTDLPNYARQYVGYAGGGWFWIYVNAVCDHGMDFDWHTDFIAVEDGGDCFFR